MGGRAGRELKYSSESDARYAAHAGGRELPGLVLDIGATLVTCYFRAWLAATAPVVAAAAGPGRHDRVPAQFRPVVPDISGEGLALF